MPTTRPRISGVWPTYFQPSTSVCQKLGRSSRAIASRAGMSVSRKIVAALTRNVAALT